MQYNLLGRTGIRVSELCYGTLTFSPLQADLPPERAGELLRYAFSRGINFLDTAQYYSNYPHIRAGLKSWNGDVVISTKCYAYDKAGAESALEEARRELDRDVIDIFMLHEQESIYTLKGHMEALETFWNYKEKGVIRAVGASTHHVAAVRGAMSVGLDVLHPLINLEGIGIADGTREEMEAALTDASALGIGIYTMKSLGGGNLFRRAEECLRYAFSLPFAASRAIGMQSEEEIDANVTFAETGAFRPEEKKALEGRRRHLIVEEECIGCGNCAKKCSQKAIKLINGQKPAVVDLEKCVLCGYCAKSCPVCAIKVI